MTYSSEEIESRKRAVFDGMSKKGQERILRRGYENWDPFQEPKDPRERIFSNASVQATAWLKEFYLSSEQNAESVAVHKELFELGMGLIKEETRARAIFSFCVWLAENKKTGVP
ncbi:MAG: hypothetical protein AB9873_08230 [Syntrophobacteraceae bacterium]